MSELKEKTTRREGKRTWFSLSLDFWSASSTSHRALKQSQEEDALVSSDPTFERKASETKDSLLRPRLRKQNLELLGPQNSLELSFTNLVLAKDGFEAFSDSV